MKSACSIRHNSVMHAFACPLPFPLALWWGIWPRETNTRNSLTFRQRQPYENSGTHKWSQDFNLRPIKSRSLGAMLAREGIFGESFSFIIVLYSNETAVSALARGADCFHAAELWILHRFRHGANTFSYR
jgi:hypothetical protein